MRWLLGAAIVGCACVPTTSALQTRFAKQYACPEDQVVVDARADGKYFARGCGHSAVYVCDAIAQMNRDRRECPEEGVPPRATAAPREREELPLDPKVK